MSRTARPRTPLAVLSVITAGLVGLTLAPSTSSAESSAPDVTIAPSVYTGGQQITFSGNIGAPGVRTVHLQRNLGRVGDEWKDVEGSSAKTDASGNFRLDFPAPTMFTIKFRVVSGALATPAHTFMAKSQDVVLSVPQAAVAGKPFVILADTTPTTLLRRPDLPPPPFAGRTLTLQRRDFARPGSAQGYASAWTTLGTARTDSVGEAQFVVDPEDAGTVVYRVRQESWTAHGDQIGWFPSFPTPVYVASSRVAAAAAISNGSVSSLLTSAPAIPVTVTDTEEATTSVSAADTTLPAPRIGAAGASAGDVHDWMPAVWDFDWPYGESLSTPAFRGTSPKGRWLDMSTGGGRVDLHNGTLLLDSQRNNKDGLGDFGTTAATLRGQGTRTGRWEARLRLESTETDARDYLVRVELVPDRAADYHCGAQNITVAEVTAHGNTLRVGAKSLAGHREWTLSRSGLGFNHTNHTVGVEVGKDHISWFLDSVVVATLKNRSALPTVPMTIRYSLVGDGEREMNRTQTMVDWMRGFRLDRGEQSRRGPGLTPGTYEGGC